MGDRIRIANFREFTGASADVFEFLREYVGDDRENHDDPYPVQRVASRYRRAINDGLAERGTSVRFDEFSSTFFSDELIDDHDRSVFFASIDDVLDSVDVERIVDESIKEKS